MFGLHPLDVGIISAYFICLIAVGWWANKRIRNQEDFFMGGRSFGKLTSLFVTFGMATSSDTAVGTARESYRQGLAGLWVTLFVLFATPFYWITSLWYRRLRMISTGDFLRQRFESRGLEVIYAVIALIKFMALIALGLLALQKTVEVLVPKEYSSLTQAEKVKVAAYEEYVSFERLSRERDLTEEEETRFARLKQLKIQGQAVAISGFSHINRKIFILIIAFIVVFYTAAGGLLAAAVTDVFQGLLLLVLSFLILPVALYKVGGFSGLHQVVPAEMFNLFGSFATSEYPWYYVAAILLVFLAGHPASPQNFAAMGGAAKDDISAQVGTTYGNFLKRFSVVLWGITGIVGYALYSAQVTDPDMIWGFMTRNLLGPGLIGLMIICLLAAVMSSADAFIVSSGALISRNLFGQLFPAAREKTRLLVGRIGAFSVILGAVLLALVYNDILRITKFLWVIALSFGPIIWMAIIWRRTNTRAAWAALLYAFIVAFLVSNFGEFVPSIARSDYFTAMTRSYEVTVRSSALHEDVENGRAMAVGQLIYKQREVPPRPVYFEKIHLSDPRDPDSKRIGKGRLKFSLILLSVTGVPLEKMNFAALNSLNFLLDVLIPFLLIILISRFSSSNKREVLDRFYAILHTPALADKEEDARQVALSIENPSRFDHQKMFPDTQIELMKPGRSYVKGLLGAVGGIFVVLGFLFLMSRLAWP